MFSYFFKLNYYYCIIMIMKINCGELSSSNFNQGFLTNTTAMNFFRFRDFEPRYAFKSGLVRSAGNKRKPRGFQFHTDDRDFSVDLEFIVPFVRIPIERSMTATQTAFRSLLNLNAQSILTTGVIVAIGGIFAIVLKIIFSQYALITNYRKSFRSNDFKIQHAHKFNETSNSGSNSDYISSFTKFTALMETKLQENNINISQCIQSSVCIYAQESFYNADRAGGSEGLPRILNGVYSLGFIQDYLSGTAIKIALDTAKNGENCSKVFSNCNLPLSPNMVLKLLAQSINFLNIT